MEGLGITSEAPPAVDTVRAAVFPRELKMLT
jgi:hypothetical protein